MIPPAFPEVREPMSKGDFKDFEDCTANPAHLDISNDHHLEPPTKKMSDEVHIKGRVININENALWVLWGVDSAILCITFLR